MRDKTKLTEEIRNAPSEWIEKLLFCLEDVRALFENQHAIGARRAIRNVIKFRSGNYKSLREIPGVSNYAEEVVLHAWEATIAANTPK